MRINADEDKYPHIVPGVMKRMFGGEKAQIFGDQYPTKDGTCVRDYVNVNDLAEAHRKALDLLLNSGKKMVGEAINLGSGTGYSNLEIMSEIKQQHLDHYPDADPQVVIGPPRPGDPPTLTAFIDKAKQFLNWQVSTPLKESIHQAYHWEGQGREYTAVESSKKGGRFRP